MRPHGWARREVGGPKSEDEAARRARRRDTAGVFVRKKIALTHGRKLCELLLLIGIQLLTSSSGFEHVQNTFRRVRGLPEP